MTRDERIYAAIRDGRLRPSMVGLRQFEVRFMVPASDVTDVTDEQCDLVSEFWTDRGKVGQFMHCDLSHSDTAGEWHDIEGIGGEYAEFFDRGGYYPTVSYLSDDRELLAAVLRRVALIEQRGNDE